MTGAKIYCLHFDDPRPENSVIINTTSRSKGWSQGLSPFFLPGGKIYDGTEAFCVENAWQYAKVYPQYSDDNKNPTPQYFEWAKKGWTQKRAVRYPMGPGVKPLYLLWGEKRYGYLESKEKIYVRLYARSVVKSEAFSRLQKVWSFCQQNDLNLILLDFDAYDHRSKGLNWYEVLGQENRKFGHGFVLAFLLLGLLDEKFIFNKENEAIFS